MNRAMVVSVKALSPTVKAFILQMCEKCAAFKAGQWVDISLPNIEGVTGYSMTSTPQHYLNEQGAFELAIKYSDHPITNWMHTKCTEGAVVNTKFGGEFYYDSASSNHLLLIAGGVGINPIISILRHFNEIHPQKTPEHLSIPNATLLYSASSEMELIFKTELERLAVLNANISCKFFITREVQSLTVNGSQAITFSRISEDHIRNTVDELLQFKNQGVECYVCGPPPMINFATETLLSIGISKSNIHSETWWH